MCVCMRYLIWLAIAVAWSGTALAAEDAADRPAVLPGTERLEWTDDIASRLVDGVDRFLLREIDQSVARRAAVLAARLEFGGGLQRLARTEPATAGTHSGRAGRTHGVRRADARGHDGRAAHWWLQTDRYKVFAVSWPVWARFAVKVCCWCPRRLPRAGRDRDAGCGPDARDDLRAGGGSARGVQFARTLAESGCRVLIPALIDRKLEPRNGRGEVDDARVPLSQRVRVGSAPDRVRSPEDPGRGGLVGTGAAGRRIRRVAVVGWGDGGMLALYSGALDPRIDVACVSGYFEPREGSGSSPSIATCSGCWSSLAMRNWPAWSHRAG